MRNTCSHREWGTAWGSSAPEPRNTEAPLETGVEIAASNCLHLSQPWAFTWINCLACTCSSGSSQSRYLTKMTEECKKKNERRQHPTQRWLEPGTKVQAYNSWGHCFCSAVPTDKHTASVRPCWEQNTADWVIFQQQKRTAHSSGGWKPKIKAPAGGPLLHPHRGEGAKQLPHSCYKAADPIHERCILTTYPPPRPTF